MAALTHEMLPVPLGWRRTERRRDQLLLVAIHTHARATACGSVSTLGRIGALLGPVIVPVIIAHYGREAVFSLGALAFVIAAVNVLILGPETKGKILEEINQ